MLIYIIYKPIQHNKTVKHYMHYVNCIYMDSETNYFMMLLVAIAGTCENSSERDKLLVNERDSVTRLLLLIARCTRLMRIVWWDLGERLNTRWMSRVRLIMMRLVRLKRLMSWIRIVLSAKPMNDDDNWWAVRWESQYFSESETDE